MDPPSGGEAQDVTSPKPGHCKGPVSLSPVAPRNVAGTLGAWPQAGRTRLWTGGATGLAPLTQLAECLTLNQNVPSSTLGRRTGK